MNVEVRLRDYLSQQYDRISEESKNDGRLGLSIKGLTKEEYIEDRMKAAIEADVMDDEKNLNEKDIASIEFADSHLVGFGESIVNEDVMKISEAIVERLNTNEYSNSLTFTQGQDVLVIKADRDTPVKVPMHVIAEFMKAFVNVSSHEGLSSKNGFSANTITVPW